MVLPTRSGYVRLLPLLALLNPAPFALAAALDGTLNVTAARTARTADQTLAAVTVLDREAIERSQALDLLTLLNGLAGVSSYSSGGYGSVGGVQLRGSDSGHLLLLIDGVPASSATLGTPPWHTLPLGLIERVEIVRGPRSHLYGSQAIGGVIQVFTREQSTPQLALTAASHATGQITASGGFSGEKTRLALTLSGINSAGFDATVGNHPDRDGSRSLSLGGVLHHRFTPAWSYDLRLNRTDQRSDYDGWQAEDLYRADYLRQTLSSALHFTQESGAQGSLRASRFLDQHQDRVNTLPTSRFDTRRDLLALQGEQPLFGDGLLVGGVEWSRERVAGSNHYLHHQRDQHALFGELQGRYRQLDLSAGLRRDHFTTLGSKVTGNLALGHDLRSGVRLTAALGTAFKAPSFNDLYYQDSWGSNGNPALLPERSRTLEGGASGPLSGAGSWELRLFHNRIDELIQWSEVEPWVWQPQNLAAAQIKGVELRIAQALAGGVLASELTLLEALDRDHRHWLPLRTPRQLRFDYDHQVGRWEWGGSWRLRGSSYADRANQQRLAGQGLLDLRSSYHFDRRWQLRAGVRNLFDHDYHSVSPSYQTPGREFFLTLLYRGG